MTRKTSKVGTLISSVVIPSGQLGLSEHISVSPDIPPGNAYSNASNSNASTLRKFKVPASLPESPTKGRPVSNAKAVLQIVKGVPGTAAQRNDRNRNKQLFNSVVLTGLNSELATPKGPGKGRRKSGVECPGQHQGATDAVNARLHVNTQASGDFNPVNDLTPNQVASAKSLGCSLTLGAPEGRETNRQVPAGGEPHAPAQAAAQHGQQPKPKKVLNA